MKAGKHKTKVETTV